MGLVKVVVDEIVLVDVVKTVDVEVAWRIGSEWSERV